MPHHSQQVNSSGTLACLLLAVTRSWALTLVILSAVPLLTVIPFLSQILIAPLLPSDRSTTATAATQIDHIFTSIPTVKAFNAKLDTIIRTFDSLSRVARTLNGIWRATTALTQFTATAMFVQGFWYGVKLVDRGKISPGDVVTVFLAHLIAINNLHMCIPQILALSGGKSAMAALFSLIGDEDSLAASV